MAAATTHDKISYGGLPQELWDRIWALVLEPNPTCPSMLWGVEFFPMRPIVFARPFFAISDNAGLDFYFRYRGKLITKPLLIHRSIRHMIKKTYRPITSMFGPGSRWDRRAIALRQGGVFWIHPENDVVSLNLRHDSIHLFDAGTVGLDWRPYELFELESNGLLTSSSSSPDFPDLTFIPNVLVLEDKYTKRLVYLYRNYLASLRTLPNLQRILFYLGGVYRPDSILHQRAFDGVRNSLLVPHANENWTSYVVQAFPPSAEQGLEEDVFPSVNRIAAQEQTALIKLDFLVEILKEENYRQLSLAWKVFGDKRVKKVFLIACDPPG